MDLPSVRVAPYATEMDVQGFDCGDRDLNDFIHRDVGPHERAMLAKTVVALTGDSRIIGFMTLSCDAVRLSESERAAFESRKRYGEYPALKIGRMAVHKDFQSNGIGRFLLNYAVGVGQDEHNKFGCRFLTVDAYPNANPFYERFGFTDNLAKNKPGRHTTSKRYDLLNPKPS